MTDHLARDAAGALIVGLPGTTASDDLRRAVAGGLGAVILFTRNVTDAEQVIALTSSLRAERPELIIAIDHEGGEFSHLAPADRWPLSSPRTLGDLDDVDLTRASARDAAATLASLGIDLMLSPSVDVNSNPANPIISTRSFGTTADRVSRHGVAFIEGVLEAGIAACPKHFPGHGDVAVDSHLDLPRVDRSIAEVQAVELAPFKAAIAAGADVIMSAHIVFSAYDDQPATLSRRILTGLLRAELGFGGVITTDALEMQAITNTQSIEDAAVASIRAGADLAMIATGTADAAALTARIVDAVGNGSLAGERVAEAAGRVRALAASLAERKRQPGLDGAPVREVAERLVAGQTFPALGGAPYVVDLAQGLHPAWHPYFSGLPEIFAEVIPSSGGVVLRGRHHAEGAESADGVAAAIAAAAGRPLVVAVQDAVRTPWIREALDALLAGRSAADAFVLCTGIPEDQALVPAGIPSAVTSGRNVVVLQAVAQALSRPA
ncbi:beta-N-acetylhexosaminidase [Kribbella sandramycini]|uniref:Beta-N-acetylhexosaminidase n=1 Tax=Kribbella sandramycini TaxID=60450 RepID=A0A7Y4KV14_9ACTN|nr:beta-N-acetylhexosaminidase [Kribbella sandramycini]MBB6568274.1 beta-N-acetylhexosaminidase [Kribbella sandramycini]NOL39133.1 beta-N-acetylhexosaminidase [Kribbella sandramycini]